MQMGMWKGCGVACGGKEAYENVNHTNDTNEYVKNSSI